MNIRFDFVIKSQSREADRINDTAKRAGESRSSHPTSINPKTYGELYRTIRNRKSKIEDVSPDVLARGGLGNPVKVISDQWSVSSENTA